MFPVRLVWAVVHALFVKKADPVAENLAPCVSEEGGRTWQVSLDGGNGPRWSADGKELFFYGDDGFIYAVAISLGEGKEEVTLGRPQALFRARIRFEDGRHYDVFADGQTFLINSWMEEEQPRTMSVVLGWRP